VAHYDGWMTVPSLHLSSKTFLEIEGDVVVIGVRNTEAGPVLLAENPLLAPLGESLTAIGITGSLDEITRLPGVRAGSPSLALIGLGNSAEVLSANELRYAAGSAIRQLRGVKTVVIALPMTTVAEVSAALEGAAIAAYNYNEYRSTPIPPATTSATTIIVAVPSAELAATADGAVARSVAIATATHTIKDLVNTPPSDLFPESFAAIAVELAAHVAGVTVTVLAEDELRAGGFGGILGVGQGSPRGPRLVKLEYTPLVPSASAHKHLALVGKGITFDSGGLSLKQPASMIGMKYDMTGAATVLATVLAAAFLDAPVRLTGWLCLAENMPSGTASRPGDVLRVRGGTTVEYLNTDAEGRLVLADGIVAASEEQPDAIVDVATLTGAVRTALGTRYCAIMGETTLVTEIIDTATETGELIWQLPLPAELRPMLNSDVADIANIKPGNVAAGTLLAGVFLQEFVGTRTVNGKTTKIPWAHLDIAGSANNDGGGYGYTAKGPTAITVRTLIALAETFSRA
jgi:leucyl aminopeptidase